MSSDEATFARLYDEHYDEVHAFCARRVGWSDADDVAAEVFTAAWRRIADVDLSFARAWLFGVARKVVLNQWRSTSRRGRLRERIAGVRPSQPEQPEAIVVRRAEDQDVIAALNDLRASDREILRLAAWEELTGPEIAVALNISLSATQQRLHRAKRRLAALLVPEPPRATNAAEGEAQA
ncbi:MAG: RNA polymerase sigma factor [Actinomycetota bacterium]